MFRFKKSWAGGLITVCGFLAVLVIKLVLYGHSRHAVLEGPRTMGNSSAPVKVEEFLDYGCAACAKGARLLRSYVERYPDQIFVEMNYFPLHEDLSALYAECAARQNKFWVFQDKLLDRQKIWKQFLDHSKAFDQMAEESGVDMEQLQACLKDSDAQAQVRVCKETGEKRGVKATPTYFVNGKIAVGIKALQEELDRSLPEPPAPVRDTPS